MVSKAVLAGAVSSLGLVVSGCATASGPAFDQAPVRGAYLVAGRTVPAPRGALDFCKRNAEQCPGALGGGENADTSRIASGAAAPGTGESDAMELFLALLQTHAAALPDPQEEATPQPQSVSLTRDRWRLLRDVNNTVNRAIAPVSDQDFYGRPDYWALPLETREDAPSLPPQGDCEDYALEKRAALIASGWPSEALSIAMAMSKWGVHAVLVAHTDRGDVVLDNVVDRPRSVERARYRWMSMQTGVDMRTWRSIRVLKLDHSAV